MKKMNKLLALVLAMVMVLGLAASAFAEGTPTTYSITINNSAEGHTYEAYQIFTGDLSGVTLSNIVWGSSISEAGQTALGDAAAKAESLKTADDAKAFAKQVAPYLATVAGSANTVTDGKYVISGLAAGYYLVKDQNGSLTGDNDAYTSYILKVVGNVEVAPKSAKPTVDKQVWDETGDAEAGHIDGWGESADHAINETFQFKLIATLPSDSDLNDYESYKLVFTDKMSAGVTFENIVSVTATNSNRKDIVYECTAKNGDTGTNAWTLTIADLTEYVTQLPGTVVTVIYNAHLNENAVIENGTPRNANTVGLEYSNNPNWSGEGEEDLGKTPEDTVWVFTYKVDNTKYADEVKEGKELANAGFRLYTDEACTDGNEVLLIKDGANYRPIKSGEIAVEMKSGDDGKFNIIGLDAGTYYLKETTTPDGYNTCDVIKIVITATHAETADHADATTTITMTVDDNAATENNVVNNSGATLPSTGGIGTTIFYVLGGMLVVCAVVLMVSKKRMSAEG